MKPSGQATTFTHDVVNRISTQSDSLGTITTVADPNGNPLTVTEGASVLTRTFDNLDRVETYTDANGNSGGDPSSPPHLRNYAKTIWWIIGDFCFRAIIRPSIILPAKNHPKEIAGKFLVFP